MTISSDLKRSCSNSASDSKEPILFAYECQLPVIIYVNQTLGCVVYQTDKNYNKEQKCPTEIS